MGKTRNKKKEAFQSTKKAIEIRDNPNAEGFTIYGAETELGLFVGTSSSISHSLGTKDTWSDDEDDLEESCLAKLLFLRLHIRTTPKCLTKVMNQICSRFILLWLLEVMLKRYQRPLGLVLLRTT